jgi:trigger factor
MREDIKVNLEREVNARIKARNKEAVMDALVKHTEMDVPKVMVEQDSQRLAEQTRQDMAQRGMDVQSLPFPADLFATKAERRVRLGLILSQLVQDNSLQATQEQVKAQIEDFAQSYEDPKEVLKYYYSDRRRLGEVEALVLEENVVNYVLGKAKVTAKDIGFDELMGSAAQA